MKTWHKPELNVLVRCWPEEMALGGCKMPLPYNTGPSGGYKDCRYSIVGCYQCSEIMSS